MNRVKFTSTWISSLKCPKEKERLEFTDDSVPSLTLRVGKRTKKFYYRFREGKTVKRIKLGAFPALTITEARRKARLSEFERNSNQQEEKIAATFAEVVEMYMNEHIPKLKAILSSIFTFAIDKNIVQINPVIGIGKIYKEKRREKIYSNDEMYNILKTILDFKEPYRSNLMLIILTAQRVSEINSLKWSDIDYRGEKITIRGENTKNGNQQVLAILPKIKNTLSDIESYSKKFSEYLFPVEPEFKNYRKSMSSLLKKVKKISGVSDFRLHDIRSKLATVLAEKGFDRVTVGKLLNHKQMAGDNSVTGYHYDLYNYSKQKENALEEWHKYLYDDVLRVGYAYKVSSKYFEY